MAEFINQIPGYEKGRVQRITATDEVSESFIVAQMASDLRKKWNTSVLCISLDGHKEAIESLIPQEKAVGTVYVLDQKNPEFKVVLRKATGIINRRFVRALIISGAERLTAKYFQDHPEKGREWIASRLEGLSRGMGIPVILVRVHEDQSEELYGMSRSKLRDNFMRRFIQGGLSNHQSGTTLFIILIGKMRCRKTVLLSLS